MSSPRVLVVLGMHKSGTSLIAATLHGAGIAMVEGDAQGHTVERASTRALNKAVLAMGHAHSLSIAAPLSPARLQPQQQAAARRLLAGLTATTSRQTPAWGFKDPRTLLTCCSTTTPSSPATQACIPRGRLLLLAAGTKPDQKGFDLLLEAFVALASCHPHWDLAIVGLDPQRIEAGLSAATLHRRAHAAGIKARHALSVADAWIAAAALQVGATLLHNDPEFRAIADRPQTWLG